MSLQIKHSGIVSFQMTDKIGILTINNGKQNKIDQADFLDLDILKLWLSEEPILGLIITGKGRHFSSGANVDSIAINGQDISSFRESLRKGKEVIDYIESLPMITVAAISGICFGAGLEIALCCQYRFASVNAILGLPESNIGIMPGLAGTYRLPKLVGRSRAIEMIVSGRSIDADEALAIGLIDQVIPKKEHLTSAIRFIKQLTENKSVDQVRSIVESVNNGLLEEKTVALDGECSLFLKLVEKACESEVV